MMSPRITDPYQIAMKLLSYRWRSERELRDRLARRGVEASEIDETIERLSLEGWIDDERFAREYVRSRARRHGRRRIGTDLRRFGIDDATAADALSAELTHDLEDDVIRRIASRKIETMKRRGGNDSISSEVGRRKLARFLLNRGYPEVAVRKVVYELTSDLRNETEAESEERHE